MIIDYLDKLQKLSQYATHLSCKRKKQYIKLAEWAMREDVLCQQYGVKDISELVE